MATKKKQIMIDLKIKEEMIEILSSMRGKTLKSIEGQYDFKNKNFVEIVRFNLGKSVIEFVSEFVSVQWHWNSDELFEDEATCFSVSRKQLSGKKEYPNTCNIVQLIKDEKISEIIVVRDNITNNKSDEIMVDSGIVVRTNENAYTFSRCDLSGFWIHMNEADKIDMYYSVKDARTECSDKETGLSAKVKREYIFL